MTFSTHTPARSTSDAGCLAELLPFSLIILGHFFLQYQKKWTEEQFVICIYRTGLVSILPHTRTVSRPRIILFDYSLFVCFAYLNNTFFQAKTIIF